jgi:predicted nucleotidyltransferase
MRPTVQSYLRYPLSALLGSEASVRVLRELALHGSELTTTLLARRTGVTDQSVRNVLAVLKEAALLRIYGQGRSASYQLDAGHPLAALLIDLFVAEHQSAKAVRASIREAAEQVDPLAVWVYGSVARGQDRIGSDLDLLLVVEEDADTERIADEFREHALEVGKAYRIPISVVAVSGADVLRLARTEDSFWREVVSDAEPLHGPGPEGLVSRLKRLQRATAEVPHG